MFLWVPPTVLSRHTLLSSPLRSAARCGGSHLTEQAFLLRSRSRAHLLPMTDREQKLTPAEPNDLANSLSFALRFEGRNLSMTPTA